MTTERSYRLPTNVEPLRYELTLIPDLEHFTFEGEESIDLQVKASTSSITINATELKIHEAKLTAGGATQPAKISFDEAAETVTFIFDRPLAPGSAKLSTKFTGTLNDQLRGFYRSQYEDSSGQKRYLATTQFEATDARRAFPCWDEPAVKASYKVTLVVPADLTAVSNMPVESERPAAAGRKAVTFTESPKMSTYLVAFIVGDLAHVEAKASNGTLVRVFATRGKEQLGQYALENSVKLLTYFNNYFGIPYPLPKLDHIAIPDFAAGAMENWGAITYRETALLFDPKNSAAGTRQRILEVVSHEMAHMWFGDLVTMEWWDDLWLNESFASWMGDKAVDHLYPEWNMWTQFVYQDTNAGLGLDGLKNSHSIEANVKDPSEIRELFDAISYSKGGATLRMIEEFLGEADFRKGLRMYIAAHEYANARGEHLWTSLQEASGKPVTTIMNSWIKQVGFPLLKTTATRSGNDVTLHLTQRRFLYDNLLGVSSDDTLWQIPVTVITGPRGEKAALLMTGREQELKQKTPANGWAKLNAAQTGFYRVDYPAAEWERLKAAVERLETPSTDRLGLQSDAYAMMRAGYAPATLFLSMAEAYTNETDVSVWRDLTSGLHSMENLLLDDPDTLAAFRRFASSLYEKIVAKVGWDAQPGEGHLDALLRSTVVGAKGSFGDAMLAAEAKKRFDIYLRDPVSLRPDLRGVVFGLVAQEADRKTYDTLWDLERKATLHEEKVRFLGAVTNVKSKALLQDVLDKTLTPDVRSQDAPLVLVSAAGNDIGRDPTWEFMKRNWAEMDRRYGKGGFSIMRLVAVTGGFTTKERYDEVENFFKLNPTPSAARTIQQSLERIKLNVEWLRRNKQPVGDWLSQR